MADTTRELYKSVIALLRGSATLQAQVGQRIYSYVQPKAQLPYVVVRITDQPYADKDQSGMDSRIRIHIFTRDDNANPNSTQSPEKALLIRSIIFGLLDRQEAALSVTGASVVLLQYVNASDAFVEPDGITWQAVIDFQALLES